MNRELNNFGPNPDISLQDVRFRCPHCQKLYKTSFDVFEGSEPEFDCSSCAKSFLLTSELDNFGLFSTKLQSHKSFEVCPKCSSLKPHQSDECPSCGVFASKYLDLQKAQSPALFELNQQWQKVVTHFDEDQYHQDFLNKCHLKLALNFAFQKYSELQKTVGYDSLCEKYIRQIELRLEQQFKSPELNKTSVLLSQDLGFSVAQMIFMGLGVIGMLLLVYNRFVPTFPNFNGLVMILTIFSFGLGLFSNNSSGFKL